MPNTSATGGPLLPNPSPAPEPLEGQSLARFLQQFLVAVSGIDGTLVRPRWQGEPPVIPDAAVAWAAIGRTTTKADVFPYVGHVGEGDGYDEMRRHEDMDVLASFYDLGVSGLADMYAARFRDGVQIAQNREILTLADMNLIETGDTQTVPSLLKQRWLYRVDINIRIRRRVRRFYPVLNILTASGSTAAQLADDGILSATFDVQQ